MAKYRIHNLDEVVEKYNHERPAEVASALKTGMQAALLHVHSTVPDYPPRPPTSSYRRTGQLGRSITTEVKAIGGRTVGTIGTNTVYAPYVISTEKIGARGPQTKFHQAHDWYTLQNVVLKARKRVVEILDNILKSKLK